MIKKTTFLLLILLLNACGTTHRMKANDINSYMISGDYRSIFSKTDVKDDTDKEDAKDIELLDALNGGSALFFMQRYQSSLNVFEAADGFIDSYFSESLAMTASREVVSNLNNASVFDYQPMVMDNIYLNSYKILNNLALKDKQGAKIEINKSYAKQQSASEYFSSEIEKANEKADKEMAEIDSKNQALWKKNQNDTINKYFSDLSKWRGYKDYMNPYITYLGGLFFMTNGQNRSDFEAASTYMKRTSGMSPSNSFIRSDLRQAENSANLGQASKDKYVWIIYENGMIADFDEIRIDVPAFIATSSISFVTFSMPKPKIRGEAFPNLSLSLGNQKNIRTETLADIDSIFIAEFNRKLPAIITRAVAQTITKSTMQYIANKEDESGLAGLAVALYTLSTSSADLRSWHTLPKNVQIAKLKVEKSEDLSIFTNNNIPLGEFKIPKDTNSIVYIRIPSIISKPVISIIEL